jgi:hypothetical protein
MTYACPVWELAVDTYPLKLQRLQNKDLHTVGNFSSCTPDMKCKTCDIRTWKRHFSTYLHQHWYTYPISLQVRRNPQHRSLLTVVSVTCAAPFQLLGRQCNVCEPLYATDTSHSKQETFLYEYILHWVLLPTGEPQNRMRELCSSVVHPSSTVDIWATETSPWTCACGSAT